VSRAIPFSGACAAAPSMPIRAKPQKAGKPRPVVTVRKRRPGRRPGLAEVLVGDVAYLQRTMARHGR